QLHDVEAPRPQRRRQLAERARVVVRYPELVDASFLALALEPLELLAPRGKVVHLLDLHAAEPLHLARVLTAALVDRRGPDLRRDRRLPAARLERAAERRLGAAVHRGRVEQ